VTVTDPRGGIEAAHVFAGLAVRDYDAAREWYERLLGRPPDMLPIPGEAVWRLTPTASLYILVDRDRAGSGVVTIAAGGLDGERQALRERGIAGRVETTPEGVRKLVVRDPDGNTLALFEAPTDAAS
jgi:catechol 2,3-dioxygenase-like lactoylglutathione lyase family enzyme